MVFSTPRLVPGFPNYTGPYHVGSCDIETPVPSSLSFASCPDPAVTTISFRIFYPCAKPSRKSTAVHWISDPQQEHVSAFARFVGASNILSNALSYIPNLLYYAKIPVSKDAHLLEPEPKSSVWPVLVFSHGLGGSRNSYSHICGSLASYGIIVIAPEHRDGSCPISIIRGKHGRIVHRVQYRSIPHTNCPEVQDARDEQLKIRLWELAALHGILHNLNEGSLTTNYTHQAGQRAEDLPNITMFKKRIDLEPGRITWMGHSFGAASVCQFVKSIFYRPSQGNAPEFYKPIYIPDKESSLIEQITPSTTIILLDPWALPLVNPKTQWLNDRPLPSYHQEQARGNNVLAVLSEAFFKWNANLVAVKRALSEDPSRERHNQPTGCGPYIFYPQKAAHLSQSDFGILFPTLTRLAVKSEEPERILRLNVRATLEVMRLNGIQVASTSSADMELAAEHTSREGAPTGSDKEILRPDGCIRGWIGLNIGQEDHAQEGIDKTTSAAVNPDEAAVDGKM